jgi:hypothetical protein
MKNAALQKHIRIACWTGIFLLLAGLSGACGSGPKVRDPLSKEERRKAYFKAVKAEALRPVIDTDGDIRFKRGGLNYYVIIADAEPGFVRVVLPGLWEIESEEEQRAAVEASSYASRRSKVAKVYLSGSDEMNVSVSAEVYFPNPQDFAVHFPRMLLLIDNAASYFESKMRERPRSR